MIGSAVGFLNDLILIILAFGTGVIASGDKILFCGNVVIASGDKILFCGNGIFSSDDKIFFYGNGVLSSRDFKFLVCVCENCWDFIYFRL